MNMSYYEAYKRPGDPDWYWKVYHWNADESHEIVTARSKTGYATEEAAIDAAVEYLDNNGLDAVLA
jgi:hypothetical protein